jgi:hypothetical protein
MAIGPDGAVYMIEYGSGFWNNTNSRVSRIVPATAPAQASRLRAGIVAADLIPGGPWAAGVVVVTLLVGAALKRRKEVVR